MSLPDSSNGGRRDTDTTLVTVMLAIAAIFFIVGTILLSIPLKDYYDKFFWNF